jgi:hypothetical protein
MKSEILHPSLCYLEFGNFSLVRNVLAWSTEIMKFTILMRWAVDRKQGKVSISPVLLSLPKTWLVSYAKLKETVIKLKLVMITNDYEDATQ